MAAADMGAKVLFLHDRPFTEQRQPASDQDVTFFFVQSVGVVRLIEGPDTAVQHVRDLVRWHIAN